MCWWALSPLKTGATDCAATFPASCPADGQPVTTNTSRGSSRPLIARSSCCARSCRERLAAHEAALANASNAAHAGRPRQRTDGQLEVRENAELELAVASAHAHEVLPRRITE